MNIFSLLLAASLLHSCATGVEFTYYQQEEPARVVFLAGGSGTSSDWWFSSPELFDDYPDTLFVGVGQSCRFKEDLGAAISWVKENYDFPNRSQWSFVGFSLGAYETYNTALQEYHSIFGNYAAIGGGTAAELDENPQILFFYVVYGSGDVDVSSADYAACKLEEKGYINGSNYKKKVITGVGHSKEEAHTGLLLFLDELDKIDSLSTTKLNIYSFEQADDSACIFFGGFYEENRKGCPVYGECRKRQFAWVLPDLALARARQLFRLQLSRDFCAPVRSRHSGTRPRGFVYR